MAQPEDFYTDERLVAPRRPPPRRSRAGRWIAIAVLLAVAIAVGIFLALRQQAGAPTPRPLPSLPDAVQTPPAAVRHPVAATLPDALDEAEPIPPLPSLADSDTPALDALAALIGAGNVEALVIPQHVIPRIVATVDNLPQRRLGARVVPLRPPGGRFEVEEVDGRTVVAAANAQRYQRHVALLEATDTAALVAAYARHYPLFQQAYEELGYPDRYFNDRVVEVIDHLLAAPEVAPVLELRPEKSAWAYAEDALEQASAGHRLMFRLGPDNARRVKAKLREIRTALATGEMLEGAPQEGAPLEGELPEGAPPEPA